MNKTLIELMLEANVEWPEGAEFAAQDKLYSRLRFYTDETEHREGRSFWGATITTRAEYEAAQDKAERDRIFGYADEAIDEGETPEQEKDKEMTIEQKIKDMVFHQESIARYQEQIKVNQVIVDNLRSEITADLAALGWGEPLTGDSGELEITDWRELKMGDVVEITDAGHSSWLRFAGEEMTVVSTGDSAVELLLEDHFGDTWVVGNNTEWKFIRRPSANK